MRRILPLAVTGLVLLAACGDDDSADDTQPLIATDTTPDLIDR